MIFQRLRTENRLLRQRIDLLEQESSHLADRLIQGQVTRAEVEESTFAIKRELAAIKQHDLDTNQQLEEARDRIRKLSEIVESGQNGKKCEELSLKTEVIKQKEEMIHCLQVRFYVLYKYIRISFGKRKAKPNKSHHIIRMN